MRDKNDAFPIVYEELSLRSLWLHIKAGKKKMLKLPFFFNLILCYTLCNTVDGAIIIQAQKNF